MEFTDYFLLSTARLQKRRYLGLLGFWFRVPELPFADEKDIAAFADANATELLITTNVVVFLSRWLLYGNDPWSWRKHFTVSVSGVSRRPWSMVLAAFAQEDTEHLLSNVFTLASVGPLSVAILGGGRTLALYAAGGVAGSAAALFYHWLTDRRAVACLGASGAIYALMGFCFSAVPGAQMALLGRSVPAIQALLLNVAKDALMSARTRVDFAGHLGGLALGAALAQSSWWMGRSSRLLSWGAGSGSIPSALWWW
ncbi:unnamed protein product [Phaeothamnion confervicola]